MNFANVKTWTIQEGEVIVVKDSNNSRIIWQKQTGPDYSEPFYVENIRNSEEYVHIRKSDSTAPTISIEKSSDKLNWETLGTTSTTALEIVLLPGQKVYLRASTNTWGVNYNYNYIVGCSKVGGNIMSLLYGNNFTGRETTFPDNTSRFIDLFYYNTYLKDASKLLLPVTTLTQGCYSYMFSECSSLIDSPMILPATTLSSSCYSYMFSGCSSLITTPELPATTLAGYCYQQMFYWCTSLTTAPELPATTLFTCCYDSMFKHCTSLTTAPELPATTLVSYCYYEMFRDITSLNYVKCLATSGINTSNSTTNWLRNVSSSGTFVKDSNATWPTGNNGIPSNWTIQNA